MNKEIYIWVIVILAILSVALYFRYFYQPAINIGLSMSSIGPMQLYPYQKTSFQVNVYNNGSSAIGNMSLGIDVNGNLTSLYKVTLPAGKQTTLIFNYSPTAAGPYVVSAVADPGKLYNIVDRSKSQASSSFTVLVAENATPSVLLPKNNITSYRSAALTNGGYLIGTYLNDNFNISRFSLTGNKELDAFLKPILNLTSYYIKNVSVAQANYTGNASVYSIWIKGYISPSIFAAATYGSSLSTTNVSTKAGTATYIKMLGNATFCSWYADGWIKILAEDNESSCYVLVNESVANNNTVQLQGLESKFGNSLNVANNTPLGNYSVVSPNGDYLAKLFLINNVSFVYTAIGNLSPVSSSCFGVISEANGTSYCSTYLFPKSGQISNLSLIRTTAYKGGYNITAFSLVNTTLALQQAYSETNLLQKLNVSGTSVAFESGIVNTCEFNQSILCGNMTYNNGTASFRIINNMSQGIRLNSIRCYVNAGILSTPINAPLAGKAAANLTTNCYDLTTKLGGGLALNVHLNLTLNYTVSNSTYILAGSAFIPYG